MNPDGSPEFGDQPGDDIDSEWFEAWRKRQIGDVKSCEFCQTETDDLIPFWVSFDTKKKIICFDCADQIMKAILL